MIQLNYFVCEYVLQDVQHLPWDVSSRALSRRIALKRKKTEKYACNLIN